MLPKGQLFIYGLQHVLAMYAGAVAVPLIIANAIGLTKEQLIFLINADLFTCGIATLIQTLGFGNMGIKIPMIQGVTFAAVTPMIIIGKTHGMTAIYGAIIVAGFITYLAAPYFSKLIRFFPPVVTGTIITIIGVTLMPVAVMWAAGGNPTAPNFASPENITLAFVVMILVLFFYKYFTGFLSNIAVLLGLISGTIIAIPLGMVNFSQVSSASWVGITTPFWFGLPTFDAASIAAMVLVMLVVMTETTGDCIAIGEIIEKPIHKDDLARCLRADGFSTMLGGILNSFPYTAFAQNVGLVGLTRVKSRFVVAAAGAILIALGLIPKLAAVIAAIPHPVLGGAGIVMFGMVAASGIKTLSKVNFDGTHNIMVVGISIGIGMITLAVPKFYHGFPNWLQVILHSGITAGSLAAILLNLLLNGNAAEHDVTENVADKKGVSAKG
ncbi:nucleobase:cation symporter-2 family protein [Sporomusa sp.]|uniref:nucleobase:cation symporter-2 family protein n=1 Tax=Sporomusa sp. TaxID=2078658 RepID=UPI002CF2937D|nr:nucleobase:cation symporter-2 family protein [Sporomusa sp.]HWR41750.1 nucleobase:cation symporter-2 family protein [Sporomusa sp.]